MTDPTVESIRADRPFGIDFAEIIPLLGDKAWSGNSFLVKTTDGKPHKLRVLRTEADAKTRELAITTFQKHLPKFEARDGKYVLLEWLPNHRDMTVEEFRKSMRTVGRMSGEIALANLTTSDHDPVRYMLSFVDELLKAGVFDEAFANELKATLSESLNRLRVEVKMVIEDLHAGNFMVDENGGIVFVDEDAFTYRFQGLQFGKIFTKLDESAFQEFLKGYEEVADAKWFTPEYRKLCILCQALRGLAYRVRRQPQSPEVAEELAQLKGLTKEF